MLDAAVQMFSVNGYYETSMDAIAAEAQISKPMLYLYYGSKEDLFGACLDRELSRFIDTVRADIDFTLGPKDLLRNTIVSFLRYIDANRAAWIVMYTQATSSQTFAQTVREGREQIIELVAGLVRAGSRTPRTDSEHEMTAVALVGAGEAMANRVSTGDIGVDEAAHLTIDLFWHGLRGTPGDREAAVEAGEHSAAAG
jgi:AcrR family transcriptional regulator